MRRGHRGSGRWSWKCLPVQWALKDVDLAIGAAPGATLPLLAALSRQWRSIVDAGHGREDVSVARLGLPDKR
jgi:3-hydroxyisobutyrate dehydrogenase-like beta-hydroxyacid dehydrogenase